MLSGLRVSRVAAPVAAFLVGLLAVLAVAELAHRPAGGSPGPDVGTQSMIGGQQTTLEGAASQVPFPIFRPQDPLASDSSLREVWVTIPNPDVQPAVQLKYASGVVLTLTQWPPGEDPAQSYQEGLAETGGVGSLETVNGHPAWVVPANAPLPNPAQVAHPAGTTVSVGLADPSTSSIDMTIGGVDIVLKATLPISDLMRVAASVS